MLGFHVRRNAQKIALLYSRFLILVCVRECVLLKFDHLLKPRQLKFIVLEILTDLTTLESNLENNKCLIRIEMFFQTACLITSLSCRAAVEH